MRCRFTIAALPLALIGAAATPITCGYASRDGLVRLSYPIGMTPGHDFAGRSLMSGGWRSTWDGTPPGPGAGGVSFALSAHPGDGVGQVTEMLRIGVSRDHDVVAHCGTAGLQGPNTRRLANRMLGGHRWTRWRNGDAGMSQQVSATDWRTVVDGTCYAIDRVSYAVKAAAGPPAGTPTQHAAAARLDAILASVVVGARR